MKLHKLNSHGFSHHIILAAFVVIFAVAGVAYLVSSHAATKPCVRGVYGQGAKSHCVKDIQFALKHDGMGIGNGVTVDGVFGSNTKGGVIKLQSAYHMRANGIVDGNTWKAVCGSLQAHVKKNIKGAKAYYNDSGCRNYPATGG